MYFYESHLGGIYSSSSELDWEDLYCEECGDSDYYVGEADTAEELYSLLSNNGSYDSLYINEIVSSEFGSPYEICIILKNHINNMIYANFKPSGCKFGEKTELIQYPCLKEEDARNTAYEILRMVDVEAIDYSSLKEIKRISKGNKTYIVFQCFSDITEFSEGASYGLNNGWWGWHLPTEEDKEIKEVLYD